MINEIKEMLARGEVVELECVDREGFISNNDGDHIKKANTDIISKKLRVDFVGEKKIGIYDCDYFIFEDGLKYFRIKRPTPNFDDLIDVAVQAQKYGFISSQLTIMSDRIHFFDVDRSTITFTDKSVAKGIDFIKSLYTETFVIESEGDVLNAKDESEILFTNGEKGVFADSTGDGHYGFILIANVIHRVPFPLLKGATVTQTMRGK